MSISDKNNHIEDYLDYYQQLPQSPKFAILLKGEWGSGKTWFVKQYREKLEKEKKKPLYVSLYGISKFSEIEDSLFTQLHPIRSSKSFLIADKVFKGLLKGTLKIDLNHDDKDDGTWNVSIPEISFPEKFKDSNFGVLIFDDLERCSIDIASVLGYINGFIESQNLKIVLIANENEINIKESSYKTIKEKLIGKTFEVLPDYESALNSFLCEVNDKEIQAIIQSNSDLILNLFRKSECKNLRILNQVILDFERIFKKLSTHVKKKTSAVQELLRFLVIFLIEISIGRLNPTDIANINIKLASEFSSQRTNSNESTNEKSGESTSNTSFRKLFSNYGVGIFTSNEWFPSLEWWTIFFDKGIVDLKLLEQIIPTSQYFQDENTPNWLRLWHYRQQSDKDFKDILRLVESQYIAREFEDIGIIKHITGLFLLFSEENLYQKTKASILNEAKNYIDELNSSGRLNIKYRDEMFNVYMSKGFAHSESQEFQEFDRHIKQSQEDVKIKNMPNIANQLMEIMLKDNTCFSAMICVNSLRNDVDERYYDFPIFNYLSPQKFIENLMLLSNDDKYFVFLCLEERYKGHYAVNNLVDELSFLKGIQVLLMQEIKNNYGEVSGCVLKQLNENYLVKTISRLEKINNESHLA
jgi:hypothetical protein